MDAVQLAQAFELFSRASEELSSAYNALQGQVVQLTERLNVLMSALPAGVVVRDREGRVVQLNRAALDMLGEVVVNTEWAAIAGRFSPTGTPGEVVLAEAGGERRLALSEAALESGDESIVLLHDITETHGMRLLAERNERLAAMGEMVAGLAHQLRTPLSAAMLYTANLRQAELSLIDRDRLADRAIERLRYLERLIRDMLLFARGDSLGRQRFGVCELIREIAHTLEPLARSRGIDFEASCDCTDLTITGDRKALGGAVTNLLDNAFNASGEGGRVCVSVVTTARELVFRVVDSGPGIDAERLERLFEPFYTTRAEGTGLGLAIARGVARGHGGDILVRSRVGEGAEFALSLPLQDDAQENKT